MTNPARATIAALLMFSFGACRGDTPAKARATPVPQDQAADLLINRNWIDVWPDSETDKLNVFRFVPTMGGGVFQDRTLFKGTFELFTYNVSAGMIHFDLHHTKDKVAAEFHIDRVDGPDPFDLRLTVEGSPRGPSVYYGRSSETVTDLGLSPLN